MVHVPLGGRTVWNAEKQHYEERKMGLYRNTVNSVEFEYSEWREDAEYQGIAYASRKVIEAGKEILQEWIATGCEGGTFYFECSTPATIRVSWSVTPSGASKIISGRLWKLHNGEVS